MKLRAAILILLTTLGLVAVVSPAGPAWACSCARRDEADERAELIVVGTVTEVTATGIALAVESVEKGSLGSGGTLRLEVGRHESTCGYDFRSGTRYRVNSSDGATGLCMGIREAPAAPSESTIAPSRVAAEPAPVQSPDRSWLAAGALLTVLGAGVVAVILRRRRTG